MRHPGLQSAGSFPRPEQIGLGQTKSKNQEFLFGLPLWYQGLKHFTHCPLLFAGRLQKAGLEGNSQEINCWLRYAGIVGGNLANHITMQASVYFSPNDLCFPYVFNSVYFLIHLLVGSLFSDLLYSHLISITLKIVFLSQVLKVGFFFLKERGGKEYPVCA